MKLANLFLITALVGVLAAIGCSDDSTGQAGGGGTGGTGGSGGGTAGSGGSGGGTDPCVGPLCDQPAPKEACNELIGECNNAAQVDIPPDTCDLIGNSVFCEEGAGGNGGGGGGGAGGGGGEFGCSVLGCTTDPDLKAHCEEAVQWCLAYCAGDAECQEDECLGLGLLICNVVEE